jgi:hypothetical protein
MISRSDDRPDEEVAVGSGAAVAGANAPGPPPAPGSLHYSIFVLSPACDVAEMARCQGYDLWNYRGTDGRGLRKATDFLAAYRGRIAAWPYEEIRPQLCELDALLTRADWAWGPGAYPHDPAGWSMTLQYRAGQYRAGTGAGR